MVPIFLCKGARGSYEIQKGYHEGEGGLVLQQNCLEVEILSFLSRKCLIESNSYTQYTYNVLTLLIRLILDVKLLLWEGRDVLICCLF